MPRKRTALANPTEAMTAGSPSSAVTRYFLSESELAEVNRKYPRVQQEVKSF